MRDSKYEKYNILLITGATIMLALLVYYIRDTLTPISATVFLVLFLLPLRSYKLVKNLIGIVLLIFILWFINDARQILTPFILAFVLAYLFDPLVLKLEKLRIPRWVSVLTIVLFVLTFLVIVSIEIIPQIVNEFKTLVDASVNYSNVLSGWLQTEGLALLSSLNLDTYKIQEYLLTVLPDKMQAVIETFLKSAINLSNAISAVIGQILNLVLVPFLFFYLLKDFNKIKNWFHNILPGTGRASIQEYLVKIDGVISGFFRGQLIVCLIVATLSSIGLLIFNIQYALILGLMAGVLNIIPYVGLAITLVFGILIGVFSPDPFITIIKIIVIIEVVQLIESNLLSPRIVGESVGLHPVWIIFSILIFSHFWGFLGLLLAVPAAASLKIFISAAMAIYHKSNRVIESENSTN